METALADAKKELAAYRSRYGDIKTDQAAWNGSIDEAHEAQAYQYVEQAYQMVVGVDFGAEDIAVVYARANMTDRTEIHLALMPTTSDKVAANIALKKNPPHELVGLGSQAEQLSRNGVPDDVAVFRRFNLAISAMDSQRVDLSTAKIKADTGHIELSASTVISRTLEAIRKAIMREFGAQGLHPLSEEIRWVFSVPASWSPDAWLFLRSCAHSAGIINAIDSRQLLIALDQECVAVDAYEKIQVETGNYMIVDAGDKTIHFTMHRVDINGPFMDIHELCKIGNSLGREFVDEQFVKFLHNLFPWPDAQERWRCSGMLKDFLKNQLEEALLAFGRHGNDGNNGEVFFSFYDFEDDLPDGCTLEDAVASYNARFPTFPCEMARRGKLKLSRVLMKSFFEEAVQGIRAQFLKIVANPEVAAPKRIFLVGTRFARCHLLQDTLTSLAHQLSPDCEVYVPPKPQTSVACGAVLFGVNPEEVGMRRARFTYGMKSTLLKENEQLKTACEQSNQEVQRCMQEIDALNAHITALEGERDALVLGQDALSQLNNELVQQRDDLSEENEQLKTACEQSNQEVQRCMQEIDALNAHSSALEGEKDALMQGQDALSQLNNELVQQRDDLSKQLKDAETQLKALTRPKQRHQRVFLLLGRDDVEPEAAACCQPRTATVLQDMNNSSLVWAFVAGRLNRTPQGMTLSRVELACNTPQAEETFCNLFYTTAHERASSAHLRPVNPATPQFRAGLEKLRDSCYAVGGMGSGESRLHANVVLAWHGTPAEYVADVCKNRPRSLRTTDGGYFGAGSYFALESYYSMQYARRRPANAAGEYAVILFAVYFSCAYVVTEADYTRTEAEDPARWGFSHFYGPTPRSAVALMPGYDAHFIPVRECGNRHPFTGAALPAGVDVDYQAADTSAATAHELVVQTHHQAIPLAVAWFK